MEQTTQVPSMVRTMHHYGFRCGQWAQVVAVVEARDRPCWLVSFPDGVTDLWVINDAHGQYEFR
jgi:hypothetical protein